MTKRLLIDAPERVDRAAAFGAGLRLGAVAAHKLALLPIARAPGAERQVATRPEGECLWVFEADDAQLLVVLVERVQSGYAERRICRNATFGMRLLEANGSPVSGDVLCCSSHAAMA